MNTEINGIILMYLLVILMAIPLGKYIGKIFNYEKTWVDNIFDPLDKIFFKLSGVDPLREMNWKQHLTALLTINVVWFVFSMFILTNMRWLPLNPDQNLSMSGDLAFNTSVSLLPIPTYNIILVKMACPIWGN